MSASEGPVEEVVLLDEEGRAVGTAPKAGVHHRETPLHLAFSCYLFDREPADAGARLLLTRRALHKPTWPGVWTNSFCGHPAPAEPLADAVARRAGDELGCAVREVRLVLPAFRYQAVMADGTRENEMCPVFTAVVEGTVDPRADEVDDTAWVEWHRFAEEVLAGRREVSPWCIEQVSALRAAEADRGFTAADPAELPPAARL